ncbi:MAG: hypothetical protein JW889_00330 [Verrucomicrobia bacterium]|nr:hypothetical protein [Verrucomicrobiota bacterium]
MDERSNRLLFVIAALLIVTLPLAILAIERMSVGAPFEEATANWPLALPIAFNVIVLLAAAVIPVGYFEWRPLMKFLGVGIACKATLTLLTAVGYVVFRDGEASFAEHLLRAGTGSLLASFIHAIGVVVIVAWALRDLVMGRQSGPSAAPEGLLMPAEDDDEEQVALDVPRAELPQIGQAPEPEAIEPVPGYTLTASPAPGEELVPVQAGPYEPPSPEGADEEPEDDEDLDRVVATAAPVTAELEALPDQPGDETGTEPIGTEESAEAESEPALPGIASALDEGRITLGPPEDEPGLPEPAPARPVEISNEMLRFSVEEILDCFRPEDVALSANEVRRERGDDDVRVPLDVVLPQIEEGVVRVEPDIVFSQLPGRTFRRSTDEVKGHLQLGKLELPLDRVIAQLPPQTLERSYSAEQPDADEFDNPFTDSLAEVGAKPDPGPPTSVEPGELAAAAAAKVEAAPTVEEVEPARTTALEQTVGHAPLSRSASLPATLRVNAEYVIAQFPSEATSMSIEDIEAKLRPHGTLLVPADDVLEQLAEGYVAVDVTQLLEQLPSGAVAMSWSDLRDALPGGKVHLPLDELVRQVPQDMLTPEIVQRLQDAANEIPEPFHEETAPVEAPPSVEAPAPAEQQLEAGTPEATPQPEPSAAEAQAIEIAWLELLPQFPPDAFSVGRDQVAAALEGKSAHIDMNLVRPQLGEGRVTVPCGYLLAQFPDEHVELSVEQIAERMPDGRFELPLVSVILQLPQDGLALPANQATQESTDTMPTIFIDSIAQAEALGPPAQETPEDAEPSEPIETVEATACAPNETAEQEAPQSTVADELTASDIDDIESILEEQRRQESALDQSDEFDDDLFDDDEEEPEAPLLATSVLEPGSSIGEQPAIEEQEPPCVESTPAGDEMAPVEEPGPAPALIEGQGPEQLAAEPPAPLEQWAPSEETVTASAAESTEHEVEVEMPPEEPVQVAAEAPLATPPVKTAGPGTTVDLTAAAHRSDAFRGILHNYARFHVEHGHACLGSGRLVFAFAPAETSAEALATGLPPRLAAFEQLLQRAGCGPLERAVLTAGMVTIVCQWLPGTPGNTLAVIATTDRQAAGMMHLQVKRDTAVLSEISTQLWSGMAPGATGTADTSALEGATSCEVSRPDGGPFGEISGLLASFDIRTVAQLRFGSGRDWMLASSLELDDAALSGAPCASPSALAEMPESLWLGRIESMLAVAGGHVVTLNAPERPGEPGLICIFPSKFREGLLRMKADKASAMLCAV